MRLAVIDCGTNTFNLLIVEVQGKNVLSKIFNTRIAVKLGEGLINEGKIGEAAYNRALDAIDFFSTFMVQHKVDTVIAYGTSALRDAANGKELVELIKSQYNIEIKTIEGDKEAQLIYLGVKQAVPLNESVSLIMDIGGGSNEFILADKNRLLWKQSFKMGAARILDKFPPSNPITGGEIAAINAYMDELLAPLYKQVEKYQPLELVGSSGAFDSIIEMIHRELGGEALVENKTCYSINLEQHFKISELVIKSTLEERRKIRGLVPMRFDMIVISCLMINFILEKLNLRQMRVSTYSLKEGALFEYVNSGNG